MDVTYSICSFIRAVKSPINQICIIFNYWFIIVEEKMILWLSYMIDIKVIYAGASQVFSLIEWF